MDARTQGAVDLASIKPFLLDAVAGWCASNDLTPILVVRASISNTVPAHLQHMQGVLAFNISPKAVIGRTITTENIMFTTYFQTYLHPERIVLPVDTWMAVRVKETGQHFDLSFVEHVHNVVNARAALWPNGIALLSAPDKSPQQAAHVPMGTSETCTTDTLVQGYVAEQPSSAHIGGLRLVWSDGRTLN